MDQLANAMGQPPAKKKRRSRGVGMPGTKKKKPEPAPKPKPLTRASTTTDHCGLDFESPRLAFHNPYTTQQDLDHARKHVDKAKAQAPGT